MMDFTRRPRAEPAINLTPLIDILFIVLVFLVLTTTFQDATALQVDLPEAVMSDDLSPDAEQVVRIVITADGEIRYRERAVSLPELARRLDAVADQPGRQVVLAADERTVHGRVVEVMDLARRAGIARLSVQTTRRDEP